jgi:DnaK suppressor protein
LVNALRQQLHLRRQQLQDEVAAKELALRAMSQANAGGDPSNQSDDAARHALAAAMSAEQTRDIGEMALVDAALERLRDGSFGICVGCHRRIPLRRLKAQPSAARCAACQTALECLQHRRDT